MSIAVEYAALFTKSRSTAAMASPMNASFTGLLRSADDTRFVGCGLAGVVRALGSTPSGGSVVEEAGTDSLGIVASAERFFRSLTVAASGESASTQAVGYPGDTIQSVLVGSFSRLDGPASSGLAVVRDGLAPLASS